MPVGRTITLPLAFYSNRYKSFNQAPQGARVGIPNDPSSEGRALYALQDAGIIKLRPSAGREGSPLDVISNPKKLKFVELDPAQTARSLPDLDVSAVNGNYAFLAGIMGSGKAILYEKPASLYINHIVVREKDRNAAWVKPLVKSYQDASVRDYIRKTYHGGVVANF